LKPLNVTYSDYAVYTKPVESQEGLKPLNVTYSDYAVYTKPVESQEGLKQQ